jgi:hypothetical protein
VPRSPAQLWVGNWPAFWSGDFKYDTQHLYVDWVKITELRDEGVQPAKRAVRWETKELTSWSEK